MDKVLLKESHEDLFLDTGWLLALGFAEGWACFRVLNKEWANLEPFSLGALAAGGNLAAWSDVQDGQNRRYFEPYEEELIYHSFWGVTPTRARIFVQYPPRADLGNILNLPRTITGDVGYIDGEKSPYAGPFSPVTEIFTVQERYPLLQAYNPLSDAMYNAMLKVDQRHYTYSVIKDKALVKDMLVGNRRVKKFTMGPAYPGQMTIPDWLKDLVSRDVLSYSLDVLEGKV